MFMIRGISIGVFPHRIDNARAISTSTPNWHCASSRHRQSLVQERNRHIAMLRKHVLQPVRACRNYRKSSETLVNTAFQRKRKKMRRDLLLEKHAPIIGICWYAPCSSASVLRGGRRLHEPDPASYYLAALFYSPSHYGSSSNR